ncbi:hypothetical protein PMZ80_010108 [Knufia obscura]|uniref:Major facilitator superfamily (MFS) profile domain-containing protein n=2 Tax=Knufia TaxID=430999 RepID=A0AAN8I5F4_9EURO|nr:hypothetical protein PMZ80_010108 [Knufia obscura]KAK5952849.1 hypothetical protein OHC33_005968 [Knufia fluminis]
MAFDKGHADGDVLRTIDDKDSPANYDREHEIPISSPQPRPPLSLLQKIHVSASIILLFLNYFSAQFILSYFQTSFSTTLNLSSASYGLLSGYATGIVYALLALPIAYLADYFPRARVWTLAAASTWWSLSVIFQSLSHNFWQVLLARISMGIGQSCVEALSISLISDMIQWRNVFLGSSVFYVGVYIGEAVSGQIALAFPDDSEGWRVALRSIGITGIVLAVLVGVVIRDPKRQDSVVGSASRFEDGGAPARREDKLASARMELRGTVSYVLHMRSFWLLVLSAAFRQLAGNVFGYYMPSYLANTYPDKPELLSRYGIIVGVVGSVTVLAGGGLTSLLWHRTKLTPLYLTGIGGMISALFVLLMVFSRDIADGNQDRGIKILYSMMSLAYLTAESWLGALNGLIALLLPPRYKTFGLAIWSTIQVLVYSSGPAIIGLALRNTDVASPTYTKDTQVALAVIIPICYWIAGVGFLCAVPLLKRDFTEQISSSTLGRGKKVGVLSFAILLSALVIALFVASIVIAAK